MHTGVRAVAFHALAAHHPLGHPQQTQFLGAAAAISDVQMHVFDRCDVIHTPAGADLQVAPAVRDAAAPLAVRDLVGHAVGTPGTRRNTPGLPRTPIL